MMGRINLSRRTLVRAAGAGVAATVVGTVPGRGLAAQDATTAGTGNLIIGKAQEAVGLDPAKVTAVSSFQLMATVYEQLVGFDENGEPIAELAESWENPDDTTFTFHLREGVTFHNGRPLVAADVKYSLERISDPATESPRASQLEPIASIEAPDDRTVTITLKQPYGPLLATLALDWAAIVPEEEVVKTGDLQATMVGTGSFTLTDYIKDTQSVLSANPNYWQEGQPKLAELTYKILPDEAARLAAIRTGEIGLTSLADPASVTLAGEESELQVIDQETTDYYLLGINTQQAPYDNVKVRQALSAAIDRQGILDAVFFGEGQVTGPIVPTLGEWATALDQLPHYSQDLDQARQLLTEAGLGDGFEMTILASPLYPEFINIALVIQEQLKEVGINVTLEQVEWGTFIDRWIARDFQTFVSFNGSGNDPDSALYAAFHTGGSTNAFQFGDTAIDALLEEGRNTVDTEQRKTVYQQVDKALAEAAPALFLSTRTAHYAVRNTVQGFAPTSADTWGTLAVTTVE